MSGYLLSIIGTVLLCAILTAIVPQGKTSGIIKGVAKLSCVLVIVSPVLHFFKNGEIGGILTENSLTFFPQSSIQTDRSFIEYYSEMRVRVTEKALEEEIFQLYGIEGKVSILWEIETENIGKYYEAERIKIKEIRMKCTENPLKEIKEKMEKYLKNHYCSEVLIV